MFRPSRKLEPHEVRKLNKYAATFSPPVRFETTREAVLEKAHRLLEEGKVQIQELDPPSAFANGDSGRHMVDWHLGDKWECTCHAFQAGNECSHLLAAKMAFGVKL